MKVEAFVEVLRPYADAIAFYGDERLADRIKKLVGVWTLGMSWNVKDLLRKGWPSEPLPQANEVSVEEFRQALIRLQDIVKSIAKQDLIKDLATVVEALEPRDREDLDAFVQACRAVLAAADATPTRNARAPKPSLSAEDVERVSGLAEKLETTYKDPAVFLPLYNELAADKSVNAIMMAMIATKFVQDTPLKARRAESLSRIMSRHESYVASAVKSQLSGGKSAA